MGILGIEELTESAVDFAPTVEPTDGSLRAHIVNPPKNVHLWEPGMDMTEVVELARFLGEELEALCGHRFVPKHNPDKLDACDECMRIAGEIMREEGE